MEAIQSPFFDHSNNLKLCFTMEALLTPMATLCRCEVTMVLTHRPLECVPMPTWRIQHYHQRHSSINLAVTHRSHHASLTTAIVPTKATLTPQWTVVCSPRALSCMLFVPKRELPRRNPTRPLRRLHLAPHKSLSRVLFCRTPSSLVSNTLINSDHSSSNCMAVSSLCSVRRRHLVRAPTTATANCSLSNLTICTTGVYSATSSTLSTRRATHPYQVGKLVFFFLCNQCTGTAVCANASGKHYL